MKNQEQLNTSHRPEELEPREPRDGAAEGGEVVVLQIPVKLKQYVSFHPYTSTTAGPAPARQRR